MNRMYNFTSTYTFEPAKIVWSVLRRTKGCIMQQIVIVHETPNYLEALANIIERKRKTGNNYVYKLMSHEVNKPLDLNSQAVKANFK